MSTKDRRGSSLSAANLGKLGVSSRKLDSAADSHSEDATSQSGSKLGGLMSMFSSSSQKRGGTNDEKSSQAGTQAGTELGALGTSQKQKSSWGFSLRAAVEEEESDDDQSSVPEVEGLTTIADKLRAIEVARLHTLKRRGQMDIFWAERSSCGKLPLPERAEQNQGVLDRIAAAMEARRALLDDTPVDPFSKADLVAPSEIAATLALKKSHAFDLSTEAGRRLHAFHLAGHSDAELRELQFELAVQADIKKAEAVKFCVETTSGQRKRSIPPPITAPAF